MKRKIISTLFALVLLAGLSLVPAVAMGQGSSNYAGYQFGSGGAVTWDSTVNMSGSYSVKLDENASALTYVEFIPAPGTTMSDLDVSVIKEWSFWYYMVTGTSGGPNMELRFTSPTFDAGTGAEGNAFWGHADVNTQVPGGFTAGVWAEEDAVTNPQVQTYFNDPVDGSPGAFDSSPFYLLSDTLAAIDASSVMTSHSASAADWELTRVRIELADSTNRVCYIDDVTIDGVTYAIEPFAAFDDYYMVGDVISVTVNNGNANADAMAIDTVTITAKSTTDTVGDASVTLTETSSNTGVFTGSVTLIGAAPANRTNDEIVVSDTDTVTITLTADWGNGSNPLTPTTTVDATAPVITIVSPTVSENITAVTPEIKATYTDAGSGADNATAVMKVNGSVVAFTATTSQITYTPSANLTDGSYAVTVDISDTVGNAATQKSWSFTVDTVDPVITGQVATPGIVSPNVSSNITFTATVADVTSGVDTVTIDVSSIDSATALAMTDDGVAPDATADDGIYTANITATIATEAAYELLVTATDYAGNSDSANITLLASSDTTEPVIASPAITYLYGLTSAPPGGTVTISANVTDDVGMGTVTAACTAFTGTIDLLDGGSAPDATAGDDIYTGTATVAAGTSGNYTVTIAAVDAKSNVATPDTSLTLTVTPAVTGSDITLADGWNLISLPLIPTDGSIDAVIADISDNVSQVRTWVYEAGVLTEKIWINDGPAGFTEMAAGRGYWIQMTEANELTVTGVVLPAPPQAPPSYSVYEGWNLVGFKSLSDTTLAEVYLGQAVMLTFERMYGYDAAAGMYTVIQPDEDNLQPGQGYWLAVSADGTIYP